MKENVAAAWDGIKVLDIKQQGETANGITGDKYRVEVTLDTNGIGHDLAVEQVVYNTQDGANSLVERLPFKVIKEDGNIVTYELESRIKDPEYSATDSAYIRGIPSFLTVKTLLYTLDLTAF